MHIFFQEHFDESSWEPIREDRKRKLKSRAIPSVFNDNLTSKAINDHMYSMQVPLQDISNKSDIAYLSVSLLNKITYFLTCFGGGGIHIINYLFYFSNIPRVSKIFANIEFVIIFYKIFLVS